MLMKRSFNPSLSKSSSVTLSIGVATYPEDGIDATALAGRREKDTDLGRIVFAPVENPKMAIAVKITFVNHNQL